MKLGRSTHTQWTWSSYHLQKSGQLRARQLLGGE